METLVLVLMVLSVAICIIVLCLVHEVKRLSERMVKMGKGYYHLHVDQAFLDHRIGALYTFIRMKYAAPEGRKVEGMDELRKAFENEIKLPLNTEE